MNTYWTSFTYTTWLGNISPRATASKDSRTWAPPGELIIAVPCNSDCAVLEAKRRLAVKYLSIYYCVLRSSVKTTRID